MFIMLRHRGPSLITLTTSLPQIVQIQQPSCLHFLWMLAEPSTVFLSAWQVITGGGRPPSDLERAAPSSLGRSSYFANLKLRVQPNLRVGMDLKVRDHLLSGPRGCRTGKSGGAPAWSPVKTGGFCKVRPSLKPSARAPPPPSLPPGCTRTGFLTEVVRTGVTEATVETVGRGCVPPP